MAKIAIDGQENVKYYKPVVKHIHCILDKASLHFRGNNISNYPNNFVITRKLCRWRCAVGSKGKVFALKRS